MQGFWKRLSAKAETEPPAPHNRQTSNPPRPISTSVADQGGDAVIPNLAWLTSLREVGFELDQTGLAQLYDKYGYLVHRRCLAMLQNREDAEDALQDVFLRVRKYGTSHQSQSLLGWL